MESENSEKEEKAENEKSKQVKKSKQKHKNKLIKNRIKNYLFNLISFLINNKNNFEEKLTPSDIEILLTTSSDISTICQFKYKTKLIYGNFNPKRDKVKNINIYKQFPVQMEMKDEYYSSNFDDVIVDIYPEIKEGIKIDLSEFPFFTYDNANNKLKNIDKNEIKEKIDCKDNEYILCVYITHYDIKGKNNPLLMLENIIDSDLFFKYFKNVFIICQLNNENAFDKFFKDEIIKKYVDNNSLENKNKNKIIFLFNFLSSYKDDKNCDENLINIFKENKNIVSDFDEDYEKNYFFILDNNKKIIKIEPINSIGKTTTYLLIELKNNENSKDKIPYFVKKEKEEKAQLKEVKNLIHFIAEIDKLNLDYVFDIRFNLSIVLYPNEDLTKIKLKKINCFRFKGQFKTKEYNYLKSCSDLLNLPSCSFTFTEIPSIDIGIDFSNMTCEKCKNNITDDSYLYYCYICKTKYCFECVQSQLKNNKGKKKYIDEKHNLIFFKTRDQNQFLNLDKEKLGNNQFADCSEDDLSYWSSTRCNGCRNTLREGLARYLCLNCRKGIRVSDGYIDYCSECIDKMCNNKNDRINLENKANGVIDDFNNDFFDDYKFKIEHKHDNHIYLMMPFQCNGYYSF